MVGSVRESREGDVPRDGGGPVREVVFFMFFVPCGGIVTSEAGYSNLRSDCWTN